MDSGNREAINRGQAAKNSVKCAKHSFDAFRSVVSNISSRTKCFRSSALENHKIRFGQRPLKNRVKRLHHGNVKNV